MAENTPTDPVRKALIHITVALFTGTFLAVVLLGLVVPECVEYCSELTGGEAQLPEITQTLLDASEQFRYNWYLYLVPMLPVLAVFAYLAIRGRTDSLFAEILTDYFRPRTTHLVAVIVWLVILSIIVLTLLAALPLLFPPGCYYR